MKRFSRRIREFYYRVDNFLHYMRHCKRMSISEAWRKADLTF